jgi:hypothetical protein
MIRKFQSLSRCEQRLVVEATLLLPITNVALRLLAFSQARRAVRATRRWLPGGSQTADRSHVRWAVVVVSSFVPWSTTCLDRAVTAGALLRRHDHPAVLRFGVDGDERFTAHAWVESDDEVVVGGGQRREFTRLRAPGER